ARPEPASEAERVRLQAEEEARQKAREAARMKVRAGFLWLFCASGYFLFRCLLDLTLVRRPALGSNLDPAGLAWLGCALFLSLIAVAIREDERPSDQKDRPASPADPLRSTFEKGMRPVTPSGVADSDLRLWVERGLTLVCHLSIVVGLVLIGWRHFNDLHAGMSAATFYLLLPYTYLLLPSSPLGVGRW